MLKKKEIPIFEISNYILFTLLAIIMVYPFWYVLMFSLSNNTTAINNYYLVPNEFSIDTYLTVFRNHFILVGYKNNIIVTVAGTILALVCTAMTSYPLALAKKMPGRKFIFYMMFFTSIFSPGIIPTFLVINELKLINTYWALIIPGCITVFYMLIMIKFFQEIPGELLESAKIDGYNDIQILYKIILPLSPAVIASMGLFYAIDGWNQYLTGILYINDQEKQLLQVILLQFLQYGGVDEGSRSDAITTPENLKMATVIATVAPILIVYPFLQKYFMKGVMIGSVKG